MNLMEKISIAIPTYNSSKFIKGTDSILSAAKEFLKLIKRKTSRKM